MIRTAPRLLLLVALLATAACGSDSTTPTSPGLLTSVAGTWSATATDSSTTALGLGAMMGQAGMGTMTLQLAQNGSTVTGTMSFPGMSSGMTAGAFTGTLTGQDLTFTMDMPRGSMMNATCTARATGSAHMDSDALTMRGTYSGTNSCAGAFTNGQMVMTRR